MGYQDVPASYRNRWQRCPLSALDQSHGTVPSACHGKSRRSWPDFAQHLEWRLIARSAPLQHRPTRAPEDDRTRQYIGRGAHMACHTSRHAVIARPLHRTIWNVRVSYRHLPAIKCSQAVLRKSFSFMAICRRTNSDFLQRT
jgi:hypothetical protein